MPVFDSSVTTYLSQDIGRLDSLMPLTKCPKGLSVRSSRQSRSQYGCR